MTGRLHACPGGCGELVRKDRYACPACWRRLPEPMRDAINVAYREHGALSREHVAALMAAKDWYRDNPRGTR